MPVVDVTKLAKQTFDGREYFCLIFSYRYIFMQVGSIDFSLLFSFCS